MNPLPTELSDHLFLARCRGVGPATYAKLLSRFGSARAAREAIEAGLTRLSPQAQPAPHLIEAEIAAARAANAHAFVLGQGGYPALLSQIPDPPPVLWGIGQADVLNRPAVAIVGARNSSALGRRIAGKFAKDLGEAGFVTVSGLARGIDTIVHENSLGHGTIAVLAGGLDQIYPAENAGLARAITQAGLLLSEAPFGTVPQARHFPKRNRLVSGIAQAVVLVEAAAKSGSLITARMALEQGREVMAVPANPLDPRGAGCNEMIRQGATLVRDARDVLEDIQRPELPFAKPSPTPTPAARVPSAAQPQKPDGDLLHLLSPTPIAVDELIRLSGRPAQEVLRLVEGWSITGAAQRHAGGMISRDPAR